MGVGVGRTGNGPQGSYWAMNESVRRCYHGAGPNSAKILEAVSLNALTRVNFIAHTSHLSSKGVKNLLLQMAKNTSEGVLTEFLLVTQEMQMKTVRSFLTNHVVRLGYSKNCIQVLAKFRKTDAKACRFRLTSVRATRR